MIVAKSMHRSWRVQLTGRQKGVRNGSVRVDWSGRSLEGGILCIGVDPLAARCPTSEESDRAYHHHGSCYHCEHLFRL